MDALVVVLVILLVLFLAGGYGWPRDPEGPAPVNSALYVLAVGVVVLLLLRLLAVL